MCGPAALAAEKHGISDKWPDNLKILMLYHLAEVFLTVAIIAAFARLFMFPAHSVLRNARDKTFMVL
jgi:hypothetical protein